MTTNLLANFINNQHYDIRQTRNGRWIDQKCTMDELCFVADCVVAYLNDGGKQPFQSPDIWRTDYATKNVQALFCKPDPTLKSAQDEYNKFFRMPLKMLAAAGVLKEVGKINNTIQFQVANLPILEYLSLRERNCMEFLCMYIKKTLQDSGLWDSFESFFDEQTKERYYEVKNKFIDFCNTYTPMRTKTEPSRIFAKVINPLAIDQRKKGSRKGRISDSIITIDEIKYNRTNFRDKKKDKNVTRTDAARGVVDENILYEYNITKAKRRLKAFNERFRNSSSEVVDKFSIGEKATHMHHIFPINSFPKIADYIENIIALTSAQHLQLAHPNGNTKIIDTSYQYTCLICKTENIRKNIVDSEGDLLYSFQDFMFVLDEGLRTNFFSGIVENDFSSVIQGIEINFPSNIK